MPSTRTHESKPAPIVTADGVTLAGRLWTPRTIEPTGALLIAGATGVRQHLYAGFAAAASHRGLAALTFDFRGIGDSWGEQPLRACTARKQDWGEHDMTAALAWLAARYPSLPISLVGHSAGAQLIGLMSNHERLDRVVTVSASSGYLGRLRRGYRLFARIMMGIYFPLAIRARGYLPAKAIGMGEDLPAEVARQWVQWCSKPGYVENEFGQGVTTHYYDDIALPILALTATDDRIATPANVSDFFRLLPNAAVEHRRLDPDSLGTSAIGHIDFFRRHHQTLWPIALDWLTRS